MKLVQTMEAQKEIELQDSGLTRADFQIDLGSIENCGCEMQWLFRGPNYYSKYFVDICGDHWVSLEIPSKEDKTIVLGPDPNVT